MGEILLCNYEMVHKISFPSLAKGKCTISSHISKSGSSTIEAMDREMERKSREISVIIVVTV